MNFPGKVNKYKITLDSGYSNDWYNIEGLTKEGILFINSYLTKCGAIDLQVLQELKQLLENFTTAEQNIMYGLEVGASYNNIEELWVMQAIIAEKVFEKGKEPKMQVWEWVMEDGLQAQFADEFDRMIRENLDRITFVKDGVGLRDFLFLSTFAGNEEQAFMNNVFAVLDSDVEPSEDLDTQSDKHYNDSENRELVILARLEEFFKETKRQLFVGVGFEENLTGVDEMMRIKLEAKLKGLDELELMRQRRPFPQWYAQVAKLPTEVKFIPKKTEEYLKEMLNKKDLTLLKKELKRLKKTELLEMIENL